MLHLRVACYSPIGLHHFGVLSASILRNVSLTRGPLTLFQAKLASKRFVSTDIQEQDQQAGESITATDTGVIQKTDRETLIYFDNVYPRATSLWNPTQWYNLLLARQTRDSVRKKIQNYASPIDNPIHGLHLQSTIPVKRDGGVFAVFLVPFGYTKAEINTAIQKNTSKESSKSILSFLTKATAFPVKGKPWIEDLKRLPSTVIDVKFQGPALTEEELYSLFRRYGTILDIFPVDSTTNHAKVKYRSLRGAICAKNCVSGMEIHNTVVHIQYEKEVEKGHILRNFFVNHSRISIPVLIALFSILAVLIFEPIREFSIEQKITHKYSISKDNVLVKRLRKFTSSTMSNLRGYWRLEDSKSLEKHLWDDRVEKVNDLKMWLEENNNTFVIIRGPRGSGKHELVVRHTLSDRENMLYLDCDKLIKSRTDAKFLRNAATQLGYFPIFPWFNSFTSIIDLTVQGLTGQKSGLSETKESQFRSMLTTSLASIRRIALKNYKPIITQDSNEINIKEEDYLQQHPEAKPVVIIDRFEGRSEINGFIYKELSDWASMLVQMNIAHVIFLTETVACNQQLAESLPNTVFKTLVLSDASKENSRGYVLSQLKDKFTVPVPGNENVDEKKQESADNTDNSEEGSKLTALSEQDIHEIDNALEPLGGRMLDLQAFVRRVKSGEEPSEALDKMVEQAAEQITQIFLSDSVDGVKSAQAWELIEMLSENSVVSFDKIIFKPLFKSAPELGIIELENSGLVTVSRDRGVLKEIRPAKPLYRAAFFYLVTDKTLSKILKTRYLLKVIAFETKRIKNWEDELKPLSKVPDQKLFKPRLQYLSGKIVLSNQVINDCEAEIKNLSKPKK
ncbi:hypothetical protein TBLA_0C07010 [Henningerozyma blattae CBS 6284]|uniref:Mitochondrial escape protein 2 n=1 Tax=Henningerozyma blattae (strain ATCC 34711 / CBS 6284 / DSM 70876 / NBRC 10599 / NRRL Y-10934 / UCD 77-7) TaxID=1071380 RepID=I2H290_HENB6|nr:hypothetical protein TBLA_0C07010 [Tetrapisispora blattae CBS 6284]CCH60492.1 hypothetical protein TBLA_0C07010 [Tetrapisispora blattae CBS 6284]